MSSGGRSLPGFLVLEVTVTKAPPAVQGRPKGDLLSPGPTRTFVHTL